MPDITFENRSSKRKAFLMSHKNPGSITKGHCKFKVDTFNTIIDTVVNCLHDRRERCVSHWVFGRRCMHKNWPLSQKCICSTTRIPTVDDLETLFPEEA